MLQCPSCARPTGELTAGEVSIDVCGGCGGVWLDAGELTAISEGDAALLSGADAMTPGDAGVRYCPRCAGPTLMRPHRRDDVTVDECPSCHGLWLDSGELAALRARRRRRPEPARTGEGGVPWLTPLDILGGFFELFPDI